MKVSIGALVLLFVLQSCFDQKEDIILATIPEEQVQEDLVVLKNILDSTHAGLYAFNTKELVKALFDSVSKTITEPLTTAAFYNKIDCIVDRIRCLHTITQLPDELYDSMSVKKMFLPFPVVTINNRLYMNSNRYTIPLGAEITAINNWSAQEIISTLSSYRHIDGFRNKESTLISDDDFAFDYYIAYGAARSFLIRYIPDSGQEKSINYAPEKLKTIYSDLYSDTYFFYPTDAEYDLDINDEKKTAILSVRTFHFGTYAKMQAFSHFLKNSFRLIRQLGIKNLVVDCRNNGGGYYSATFQMLSYLVPQELPEYDSAIKRFDLLPYRQFVTVGDNSKIEAEDTTSKSFTKIRPGVYAENDEEITKWTPNDLLFNGPLFLIINGRVASAASTMAAVLQDKTTVVVVGEETFGSDAAHNSGVITYELPNSHIRVDIPTKRFYQPVRNGVAADGVKPDKYIPLTIRDVIDSYDRPLHFILDSLVKN